MAERDTVLSLWDNKDVTILSAQEGNATVIMTAMNYDNEVTPKPPHF
jgi:hypothetical protein